MGLPARLLDHVSGGCHTGAMRGQRVVYGPSSVDKMLGSLPVVAEFSRRLDLVGIIDRACPMRDDVPILSHGQVIEALVANRLTSPAPMVRVAGWAREWAVAETFGITTSALNDDRIARALDAIAPELDQVVGSVGARAISVFGLEVARLHWDMTSISLYGDYEQPDPDAPAPRFGHPKDRRPDLKQIQAGLMVTGDGAVPVFHRAYSGGAGEVGQVTAAMRACRELAAPRRFLLVGDSKLVSYANLRDMIEAGVEFIAPASKTYVAAAELAALDRAAATEVDYVAQRDAQLPPQARGRWAVCEDTMTIAGKRKRDPLLVLRRVFVHSSARAQAAASARAKKLDRAADDLDRLGRGLGSRHYPDPAAVTARVAAIARDRRVGAYLRSTVGADPVTGKPTLAWSFDQAALDAEAATDGWYALLTNLPATVDAAQVLPSLQGPGGRGASPRHVQRAVGRGPDVPARQSPDHRVDHRDLPGPADLLPDRTSGSTCHRPRHPSRRTRLRRPPGPAHRAVDPHRPGLAATDPRRSRPASDHPAAQPAPDPAAGPA